MGVSATAASSGTTSSEAATTGSAAWSSEGSLSTSLEADRLAAFFFWASTTKLATTAARSSSLVTSATSAASGQELRLTVAGFASTVVAVSSFCSPSAASSFFFGSTIPFWTAQLRQDFRNRLENEAFRLSPGPRGEVGEVIGSWLTFRFLKETGSVAVLSKVVKAGSTISSLAFASPAFGPFFDSFAPISGDCKPFQVKRSQFSCRSESSNKSL